MIQCFDRYPFAPCIWAGDLDKPVVCDTFASFHRIHCMVGTEHRDLLEG